mmetsp:Transcript_27901/g.44945  ORF Transcript_27901/g.44945 Transcript_27901/m.44945 type:complete len:242 (-) Transcript_27901:185-910(-)
MIRSYLLYRFGAYLEISVGYVLQELHIHTLICLIQVCCLFLPRILDVAFGFHPLEGYQAVRILGVQLQVAFQHVAPPRQLVVGEETQTVTIEAELAHYFLHVFHGKFLEIRMEDGYAMVLEINVSRTRLRESYRLAKVLRNIKHLGVGKRITCLPKDFVVAPGTNIVKSHAAKEVDALCRPFVVSAFKHFLEGLLTPVRIATNGAHTERVKCISFRIDEEMSISSFRCCEKACPLAYFLRL